MAEATKKPLLTQAAELLGLATPAPAPAPAPPPDCWMLGPDVGYQRRTAFLESIGARFGYDPAGIAAFVLDRWSETLHGRRWTLDPGPDVVPAMSPRAQDLLDRCFVRTRKGLAKLANADCEADMERAIARAIHEQMDFFGLDRFLPEEAPHV